MKMAYQTYKIEDGQIERAPIRGLGGFGQITDVKPSAEFTGIIHQEFRDVVSTLKRAGKDFMIISGSRTFNGQRIGIPAPKNQQYAI